jgi:minor histocompatibility antigen H13
MKKKDAYMFPFIASASLFGIYLLFKYLPAEWINFVMKCYFIAIGVFVVSSSVAQAILTFLPSSVKPFWDTRVLAFNFPRFNIPFLTSKKEEIEKKDEEKKSTVEDVVICRSDLMGLPFGLATGIGYALTNHWTCVNVLGISFSIQAISMMNLGTFMNGLILLLGLFVYDVFWVFGTEVMVSVATKFDVPIKLLFPRGGDERNAMLGLGDIVIPGIFIALMLRFDLHLESLQTKIDVSKYIPKSKSYFLTCLVSYILGMATTLFVMLYFEHAQPALLYLVPANLISVIALALLNGQLNLMFKYDEEKLQSQPVVSSKKEE